MGDILNNFGVAWPKFLAQVIIFILVYLILKRFAFGPILKALEERRERIAAGEANLEKIRKEIDEAEQRSAAILSEANTRAERLINEARASADSLGAKEREKALAEAQAIVAKGREAAELEREQSMAQLRRDFGRLVVETTSKVTGKILTEEDQKRINHETAAQVAL